MHALKIENIPFYQACKKEHTNILQLLLKMELIKKACTKSGASPCYIYESTVHPLCKEGDIDKCITDVCLH